MAVERSRSTRRSERHRGRQAGASQALRQPSADRTPQSTAAKCKSYCRKIVAFLFSHVGLCALVVGYAIGGALVFQSIEAPFEGKADTYVATKLLINQTADRLWNVTTQLNVFNKTSWTLDSTAELLKYQGDLIKSIREHGYDGSQTPQWTFSGAFLFALTIITTIGGILAKSFRFVYGRFCTCKPPPTASAHERPRSTLQRSRSGGAGGVELDDAAGDRVQKNTEQVHVPISLSLMILIAYVSGGGALFSIWEEEWGYLEGSYFCFISLSTIGFGDLVPGNTVMSGDGGNQQRMVICSLYLLAGLALIAMCFNLMQEEVIHKVRNMGKRIGIIKEPEEDDEDEEESYADDLGLP